MNREHMLLAASAISVGLLIPLADASIKGALLLGLALVVTACLRQRSAAVRHLAWVSALGLLLVLPILSAVLPGWNVLPEAWRLSWQAQTTTTDDAVAESRPTPLPLESSNAVVPLIDEPHNNREIATEHVAANNLNPAIIPADIGSQHPATDVTVPVAESAPTASNTPFPNYVAIALAALWFAGLTVFFARLVWSWLSLHRLARTAEPITQGPIFDEFQTCCRELGVTRPVRLLQGDANAMPMAWGFVRSHILVPNVCEDWPSAQRRAVLLHELGHVLRRDPLWHGLVQVATAVYWFHPLVWLAAWRIHIERERACDDLVLNRGVGAHDYAGHLLDIVSNGRFRRIGASVGVAMASSNKLEGRVRSILDNRQDRRPLTRVLLTAGLLIAIAVGTPLAMMRAEGAVNSTKAEKSVASKTDDESSNASEATSDEVRAATDNDPQTQSMQINYDETMLVVWNEAGAVGVVFDSPQLDINDSRSAHVICRYRFNDGGNSETTGEQFCWITGDSRDLALPITDLRLTNLTTTSATVAYDPAVVCVHPLDRTFFEEYDLQIPFPEGSDPQPPRPPVDLTQYLLPDVDVQQQIRNRPYDGQNTIPGYPRTPLPFKVRYADNGLVVATPEGVAVFDFLGPLDRREGNERRQGVEYRWRFVSADGATDETGEGEIWEFSRDGQSVYAETLHYLEAGPIHIPWSINYAEAGWIYYDPAGHGVWLIAPEVAHELADTGTDADRIQQFAFGPRAAAQEVSFTADEASTADEPSTDETTLRGFNLAPYRFAGEWTALYEPGAPLDRELAIPLGGCWRCVVNPGNWRVHYSPVRDEFYLNHTVNVHNGEGESVFYGPIAGNPIELLRLDNFITESINRHREVDAPGTPQGLGELRGLIDSNEPTLVAAGFRILANINQLEVHEEHYLRQSVDAAAEWMGTMPDYEPLVGETLAAMDRHHTRIEELQIEVPADDYGNSGTPPTDEELALNWGPEVDGLRLAVQPWEAGEPSLRLAERVEVSLLIQNVSDEPIRFSTFGAMDNVRGVLINEETKNEQQIDFAFRGGYPVALRYQLNPGDVMRIKQAALWSGVEALPDGSTLINVESGHTYRLSMSLQLPELFRKDGEGRILNPARGEYFNRLEAGIVRIRVAEIDGTVPAETGEDEVSIDTNEANTGDDATPGELTVLHEDDDGTMRLTPTNADEREVVNQILIWGSNDYDGWRVGALFVNDLDTDEPLTAGETAGVRYFLQNITDEPKSVLVAPMGDAIPVMGSGGQINLNTHAGSGTVEITAQPGEAVSPDGHYVLVDTTGLPDGEYELYSTAAFWMQNADGSGSSSPWRVGGVPMTIGSGGKFDGESMTDDEGIVWGGTVAGLRVGMRLPEGEKQWAVGSLLQGDLFVKNTTTQSITFTWDKPAPLDQNQVVYTADGEYVQLNRVFYTGARAQNPQTFTVEPGEQIALGDAKLQSVAVASQPGAEDPAQLVAATGSFTWQVHVQLNVPSIPQFLFVVGSGPVPIEIVSEEQPDEGDDEANNDPSQGGSQRPEDTTPNQSDQGTSEAETPMDEASVPAFDDDFPQSPVDFHAEQLRLERERLARLIEEIDLVTRSSEFEDRIAWGPPHEGWRAGMVIIGEDEVVAGDRVVVQFYVQNVTEEQQTLRLRKFTPGVTQTLAAYNTIQLSVSGDSSEFTRLTADAGEIVLLRGYLSEFETSGLPDGEYVIEANTENLAYWVANPQGLFEGSQGQASLNYQMGRSTLRIGERGEPADNTNTQLIPTDDQIWWGPDVAGMRIGMQMLHKQTDWPVGSRIESVIHVMNSTDHDITFETWWDLPSNLDMSVYTADEYVNTRPGEEMTPLELDVREIVVYDYFMRSFTIPAGEMRELGHFFLDSGAESEEFRAGLAPRLTAESGTFKWVGRLQFQRADLPNFYCNMETGPAYFSIVAGIAANSTDDAPADDDESDLAILHEDGDGNMRFTPTSVEERAVIDQILIWTDPVDGWRVGSLLMNDLESNEPLTQGDTATVRYFMQNVSDQPQSITVAPIDDWSRDLRAGGWMVIETRPGRGPVEFSAAPGEAVSPSGFSVDVDTTGLADGKYELDATTVFWRQDADGNGASSPWRVAGVPMIVGTGESLASETMTDEEGIHWGEVVSGLRLGLRSVDGKEQWPVGSLIEADLFVKNTTEQLIIFAWDPPPPGEQGQSVYDSDWEHVHLNAAFYTGIRRRNTQYFTIEPGTQFTIGKALLQSVSEASTPGPSDPMQLVAAEGHFYWVMNVFVEMQTVPQIGIVLGSGTEEFDIVAADAADATSSLSPENGEAPSANDDLESSISWGEPADGWRTGMRIEGDAEVEAGEQVTLQFYVQNMSDAESTLWFGLIENAQPFLHAGGVIRCNAFWARSAPIFIPTTITAAPGEIAQLEKQFVTLDTTGLPEGDYLVEANAANRAEWILDSQGAASTKHFMTPARLRIGQGGQFPDVTTQEEVGPINRIFWGHEVAGLRLGIKMKDQQLAWPVGSRIEARIVAENLTSEEIEFTTWWGLPPDHDFNIFEDPDTPVDLDIRELVVFKDFNRTFRVAAGEQVEVGTLAVDSRAEVENYEAGRPPRLIAEPGRFRWEAAFNVTRPELAGCTSRLVTGRAYFELTE